LQDRLNGANQQNVDMLSIYNNIAQRSLADPSLLCRHPKTLRLRFLLFSFTLRVLQPRSSALDPVNDVWVICFAFGGRV
jgi:hypothetical protein